MPATETLRISWPRFHLDALMLAEKIKVAYPRLEGLIAVTRGGLVAAGIIADWLDIRLVDTIGIRAYEQGARHTEGAKIFKYPLWVPRYPIAGENPWLFIDELTDTGLTAQAAKIAYPTIPFACVYVKPLGKSMVDLYAREQPQELWLQMPWEKD